MLRSVNLDLFPNLGVRAHQTAARNRGHSIIACPEFHGCGAAFSILEFFRQKSNIIIWEEKPSCLIERKRVTMKGVMRRE
jgi:hypothetical protein